MEPPRLTASPSVRGLFVFALLGFIGVEGAVIAAKVWEIRYAGTAPIERTITVTGIGKVLATPNVATITAGFTATGTNVRTVQQEVNERTAALATAVKDRGVEAADVQTSSFTMYPYRSYEEGSAPRITGYEANQHMTIRVRDVRRVNDILGAVGASGATDIGGLQFTIDDPEALKAQAREEAIVEAREKAQQIAVQLGRTLGRAVAFSESSGDVPEPIYRSLAAEGFGGGAPAVEMGTNDVTVTVSVTYELR